MRPFSGNNPTFAAHKTAAAEPARASVRTRGGEGEARRPSRTPTRGAARRPHAPDPGGPDPNKTRHLQR